MPFSSHVDRLYKLKNIFQIYLGISIDAPQRTHQSATFSFLRIEHLSYKTLYVSEMLASKHLRSTLISYDFANFLCFSTTCDEVNKLIRKSRIVELDGICCQVYTVTRGTPCRDNRRRWKLRVHRNLCISGSLKNSIVPRRSYTMEGEEGTRSGHGDKLTAGVSVRRRTHFDETDLDGRKKWV